MTTYDNKLNAWIEEHRSRRSGSRLERIAKGLGHAGSFELRRLSEPIKRKTSF